MSDFPKFQNYVCPGDSISWTAEGFELVARIVFDEDTKPTDFDCYDEEQVNAWRNDEWFFCGIVVRVSLNGVELSDHAASLWGIDCNFPGSDNAYLAEVAQELQSEALESAKQEQARILAALGA